MLCDSVVVVGQDPVQINNVSSNTTNNYVLPFELVEDPYLEGMWNLNVLCNSKAESGAGHFVGEDGAQTWIDGDEGRSTSYGAWIITEIEDGWRLQNDYASNTKYQELGEVAFGVDGNNTAAGWATTWTDLVVEVTDETTTRPWTVWRFVSADNGEAVKAYSKEYQEKFNSEDYQAKLNAFNAAMAAYRAKLTLKDIFEEAEIYGVSIDAALAVYENENATEEEVLAAISKLRSDIKCLEYDFTGASEDNPLDVTDQVLTNADFSTGDITGWDCTFQSGVNATNVGYQSANYSNQEGEVYQSGEQAGETVFINQFIEAWRSNADPFIIGDGFLRQTVYALPAGKYVLEADVISVYQWTDAAGSNPTKGVYLYIKAGDNEAAVEVATNNGSPKHFSVTFVNDGNSDEITFGLKTVNATANWIAADNFTITYYGETSQTPAQATLSGAVKSAEDAIAKNEEEYAYSNKDVQTALEEAITSAKTLTVSGSDEDCAAALEALQAAKAEYDASVAAYKKLRTFLDEELPKYEVISGDWAELNYKINDLMEDLEDAYLARTITTEEIDEQIASVLPMIREYIAANLEPGRDVTLLLINPDFSTGTTTDPTGWSINSGSLTELASATGNIEVYHKTFDLSQTIINMPAGVYDITVQGFVRHDGSSTDATIFYAGDLTTSLMTLEDQWSYEPIYIAGGENPQIHDSNYDLTMTTPSGETAYKCNGMGGAYYWFQTPNPGGSEMQYAGWQDGDNYYTNHIKAVLLERGDFTIGLKSTATTDWVIWDNFQITYLGQDMSAYYEMIDKANISLTKVATADGAFVTAEGQKRIDDIAAKVDNKGNIETADDAMALIAEINATAEYITEGNKKGASLITTHSIYNEYITDVNIEDESWYVFMEEVSNKIGEPVLIENNEAIDGLVAEMKAKWPVAVMYSADEEPTEKFDATAVIFNPSYDLYGILGDPALGSSDGWTIENIGGAAAAAWTEVECYNNDTINVYQNIEGLKPGFYEVALQGYYRAGFPASVSESNTQEQNDSIVALYSTHNVHIYATTSLGEMTAPLMNAMESAQEYQIGVGSESAVTIDGFDYYIPNNMEAAATYFENEFYPNHLFVQVGEDGKLTLAVKKFAHIEGDWTIFTDWQLFYLGKTGANFSDELDAIESVKATELNAAQIFGIDGRQQNALRRGINIVRTSDGSVRKVLVK